MLIENKPTISHPPTINEASHSHHHATASHLVDPSASQELSIPMARAPAARPGYTGGRPSLQEAAKMQPHKATGALKRGEDILIATFLVFSLLPVLLVCAVAIRLETPGPIIFHQRRFGLNGTVFNIYKFRTMHANQCDASGAVRTIRNDNRVTRVGRFLRASSLDELPQLFNVLQGEMSLVGPRPHAIGMRVKDRLYHEAVDNYAERHRVRPGITGLAQVNGLRGEIDTLKRARQRLDYDLHYIDNWSFALDFRILMQTVCLILRDTNAF